MSDCLHITRLPRPYDAALGAETRDLVAGLAPEEAELIAGTAGSSPYLRRLIEQEADWIGGALGAPKSALAEIFASCRSLAPDQLKPGLRQAKRRVALLTALCDLCGGWSLEEVTGALTDFGALSADVAIKAEIAALIRRKKLPGLDEAEIETAGGLSILAMGKMGAHELNYSSDIDLICLFDETRFEPDAFFEARQSMVRATRNMCATLSDRTSDGYVFRTDLRLRPDPGVTPVCLAMEAAERYYESLGRTWERAAYIKARPCAGDLAAGEAFLKTLRPFVWRRHLDFAAIQDAHDMRLRIRENKGTGGPITVPGHDMKLGRGGIREIEFFTQTRQLIAGGRDESLRLRGTVEGLHALAARGWIPDDVAARLSDHYRAHRDVEHRIQMVHDAQTHRMPSAEEGIARVACLMGQDPAELQRDIHRRLVEVHELTEDFFAPDAAAQPRPELPVEMDESITARWRTYPALRSQRGAQIFERLKPDLLARLSRTAKPAESLLALDGFLAGLPAGVQLFSLFEANPQLLDLLVDIVGTSPALAGFLSRNSGVFDAVIGGSFFEDWPGGAVLCQEMEAVLDLEEDYEAQLDGARRWCKEWHFRIGVHHLRGLIDGATAGAQYGELAEAVIKALLPRVIRQFSVKHGPPPGSGPVVVAMGSLGAGQINAQSDLDIIVIYDPEEVEMSEGRKPLGTRAYYARLTQALITGLSAPMSQGRLYEVDMRLRPSGNIGPVATSWSAYSHYQQSEAWVWEHLALTRARGIAGNPALQQRFETFRRSLLAQEREVPTVLAEVAAMRQRLAAAKRPSGVWDAKTGAGRMMDIELLSQAGALLAGRGSLDSGAGGEVAPSRDVVGGLQQAVARCWLDAADARRLHQSYDLYWSVQTAARLISQSPLLQENLGEGGAQFLCSSAGFDCLEDLEAALEAAYRGCDAIIAQTLQEGVDHAEPDRAGR
ncbi:glutamine-synthetase adenylyltransferase [Pseudophaeobacter profundi]|uniref:[protein-PII] uridylyltransferase family protein n=1 Tax=Pseudophaeobacter profundi TaxID=3034152 RepID=UPI00242FA70B|nr:glutamine-synthetase adenylyltransferase [Pseudophaeobacter profundi]